MAVKEEPTQPLDPDVKRIAEESLKEDPDAIAVTVAVADEKTGQVKTGTVERSGKQKAA